MSIERRHRLLSRLGLIALVVAPCAWWISRAVTAAPASAKPPASEAGSSPNPAHPHVMGPAATQARGPHVSIPSKGCVGCHKTTKDPHPTPQGLSCVDCHGGKGDAATKEEAHPRPRFADMWPTSANPHESYARLNGERYDWIRFMNPSDLRVASQVCGECHPATVRSVQKGSMVNSAQVFSTGLYNNASVPFKDSKFAENYTPRGEPQIIRTLPPPTAEETRTKGILPVLFPLPRFEVGQPGNIFRVFERGGGPKSELGNPNREDVPGQPDVFLSNRGFGTQASVDPVILGAQKTRLNDPVLSFLGTNDSPGDYRNSGCAACHVIYANDRDKYNSGPYAEFGNRGMTVNDDPMIPKNQSGHPIKHEFTRKIPSSQCITCHVHNGNGFLNSYLGYMWWDEQTDGERLYPKEQRNPTAEQIDHDGRFNPEEAASRGLWNDPKFLETVSEMNPTLKKAQFSDYHGHGWMFQKVYKRDRRGSFLDAEGKIIPFDDAELWKKAVHLKDIHLERGMHCVDCHFSQDAHGSGKIYGDRRAAIEIACQDCHGTASARATLTTSGPAAAGRDLATARLTPFGVPQFARRGGAIIQRSMVEEGKTWTVPQVTSLTAPKAVAAHTIQKDGLTWGDGKSTNLAHSDRSMTCYSCHSSWTTNCFGCHLSAKVNTKKPMLHNEGTESQVYASYNPEVLRTDGFMLGIDGTVQGHKVAPVRSSSAVTLSVQNANRSVIVNQVPTISAAGFTGNAFNTHVPHTVRAAETKQCTDCHVSKAGDNNAWMASVLMLGTNQVNYMGRFIYVAEGSSGFRAVAVTELEMPSAVFGSHLHRLAYPANFAKHVQSSGRLLESAHHGGRANQVQLYGEYLLSAAGSDGLRVFDVANVANKDFAQRIVTAPVASQRMSVDTQDATGLAVGSPAPLDLRRVVLPVNEEQAIAPIYGYAFVSDAVEGLVVVDIQTLSDGVPTNNSLKRSATFNPNGVLTGASSIALAGDTAYITSPTGLTLVDVKNPLQPRVLTRIGAPALNAPRDVAIQFRYAFVTDSTGLKVVDVTVPERARIVEGASVAMTDARGIYLSRTYAYVAAGADGLAIVDIEQPERPRIAQKFNAGGAITNAQDVKVGMVNVGLFAYVADGKNGLQVIELTAPDSVPGNLGFSPAPNPRLVASYRSGSDAVGISEGYRRDRGVDESGHQIGVFGRRGARPFNLQEMQKMYIKDGKLWTVTDEPPGPARGATGMGGGR
jgi:hypothetical protein